MKLISKCNVFGYKFGYRLGIDCILYLIDFHVALNVWVHTGSNGFIIRHGTPLHRSLSLRNAAVAVSNLVT